MPALIEQQMDGLGAHVAALLLAYLLALPIGWNRERNARSAGLRTFPLVAVATCGFIQATETITAQTPEALARIIEGLITGIGFIGGGAILRNDRAVIGTATAASLWITGAIGVAVGLEAYALAIVLSALTIATFWAMHALKRAGGLPEDESGLAEASNDRGPRNQP